MRMFVNPGNENFREILQGEYVDKTGLIAQINRTVNTPSRFTCFARPRRFGKSFAVKMLAAYYDGSCDSRELFQTLAIAGHESYLRYINQFDVICLDIFFFVSTTEKMDSIVSQIQSAVIRELNELYPGVIALDETQLVRAMTAVCSQTNRKFIVIIDEWDALFREERNNRELQKRYIGFLRGLFKGGTITDRIIAAAYMTGILPIKKYGTESALTDFQEYTMVDPAFMAEYVGFTEHEVKTICDKYHMDVEGMKQWYDGYHLQRVGSVYSPNSVMQAASRLHIANYWTRTESFESLTGYISMNMDGLRDAIIAMLGGKCCEIEPLSFQNDLVNFKYKDDVLTYLVHLGYLAYDETTNEVYIPNLEVAESFRLAVRGNGWEIIEQALANANRLLQSTIQGDEAAVSIALDRIHRSTSSVLQYNDENSLSCALTIAYYTARKNYVIIRELPAGKGLADLAFLPRSGTGKPPMIVE